MEGKHAVRELIVCRENYPRLIGFGEPIMYRKSWRYYRDSAIVWTSFFLLLLSAGYDTPLSGILDHGPAGLVPPEHGSQGFLQCTSSSPNQLDRGDNSAVPGGNIQIP